MLPVVGAEDVRVRVARRALVGGERVGRDAHADGDVRHRCRRRQEAVHGDKRQTANLLFPGGRRDAMNVLENGKISTSSSNIIGEF